MVLKTLPRIEYRGDTWIVDGRLGELRNEITLESLRFEDIEDMVLLDLLLSDEEIKNQMISHIW